MGVYIWHYIDVCVCVCVCVCFHSEKALQYIDPVILHYLPLWNIFLLF